GAREFLVPTRRQGYAYALPQSPQQYKQMLMASGITRYFQFAKCFRDEDHRADRQPEFTQLDIEMAFANSTDVMRLVSSLVERIFHHFHSRWSPTEINGIQHPVYVGVEQGPKTKKPKKGDATEDFWDRDEGDWAEEADFPEEDQEVSEKKFGIWEGKKRYPKLEFKDIKFMTYTKAMKHFGTDKPDLRINAPYFTNEGLIPKDNSFHVVWVHQFPLFTPNEDNGDPGQGGTAGFSSTHHPFTAPLTVKDFFCAKDKPFNVKADNYDLVINGVEVGGGSRRIHAARHQDWILRDVLKMTDEGMAQFSHLLEALRAGCPPHAGFAFGFDRLIAVMCDVPSVRDVIAFPKNNKGEDQMVGSPAKITPEQRKTYHIFQELEPESEVGESESKPAAEP
ncbi:hypothetical protein PC116_g29622, partial [Phytophthora cactorum]